MKTKPFLAVSLFFLVTCLFLLVGCAQKNPPILEPGQGNKPTYIFRLAETHPPDYPTTMGDKKFAQLVAERTHGRIKIDVFPSGQLGEERAVLEQVQLGAIEFTRVSASPLGEFNKQFGVYSLPYIFDNAEHEWRFLMGEYANKMLDHLEKSNMKGLAYYDAGARNFYAKQPITKVEDLEGMEIRVQQSKINIDMVQSLGARAMPLPYGQVLNGLSTGVIDCAENNIPSYFTAKHYQAARNYIMDGHQRIPEVLLISKVVWDNLSPEDRGIIKQAAVDSVKTQRERWQTFEQEAIDNIKEAGINVIEIKDITPWQDAVQSTIDNYREEYKEELEAIANARS